MAGGYEHAAPMRESRSRARLWRAMRILRTFTVAELSATAEVSPNSARKYVRALAHAGYLRVATPYRQGAVGGHASYLLIRDTGPHAPSIGKQRLRDPNLEPDERDPADRPVKVPKRDYDRALACVRACAGMADPEAEVAELKRRAGGAA